MAFHVLLLSTAAFDCTAEKAPPSLLKRFVHYVVSVIQKMEVWTYLEFLNEQHPQIRFTGEVESEGSLPFVDVPFLQGRKPAN